MRIIVFFILLVVSTFACCHDQEELVTLTLKAILNKQDALLDGFKELQERLQAVEINLQGIILENGESMKKGQQDIKSHFQKEIEHLISLAETDECASEDHKCGSFATCEDTVLSFRCVCPPGFTWNGVSCEDLDECGQGIALCDVNSRCSNTIGSYRCQCNPPYKGNGQYCEFTCESPAKIIKGLGCMKFNYNSNTFQGHKEVCEKEGGRLLQHFGQEHLPLIKDSLGYGWIGVYEEKWLDVTPIDPQLWKDGYRTNPSKRCGFLAYNPTSVPPMKISQRDCSTSGMAICHFTISESGTPGKFTEDQI